MFRVGAAVFLIVLFGLQFYRAATQSITVDEAHIYLDIIRPDPPVLLKTYDAGHHVLQTYLSWMSSRRWGGSELVLRIPALLACIGWFAFCYRYSEYLFGRGATFLAGVLVLASNPLLLDHLTLARGYGLGAAFFGWSLHLSCKFFSVSAGEAEASPELKLVLQRAAILSALAVASNLTFLIPVGALVLTTVALIYLRKSPRPAWINEYFGPAITLGSLIMMLPLTHVDPAHHYYFGAPTPVRTVESLVMSTFDRRWNGSIGAVVGYSAASIALMLCVFGIRRRSAATICAAILGLGSIAAVAAHYITRTPYPLDRTGLWILVTLTAGAMAGCAALVDAFPRLAPSCAAGLFALAASYLYQYDVRYVLEWRSNEATKHFMAVISHREASRNRTYVVSGSLDYKHVADYYRTRWKLANMTEMKFGGPHAGADYYLLHDAERNDVARLGATVLEERPLCRCLLAAR